MSSSIIFVLFFVIAAINISNGETKMTDCISKFSSCDDACSNMAGSDEKCSYTDDTQSCGWTTSKCICDCVPKSVTAIDYSSKDYGVFDKVVKKALEQVNQLACLNEDEMWATLLLSPTFLNGVMEQTQKESLYSPVRAAILQFPQFFDFGICEADFYFRNWISKIPGSLVTETITTGGKAGASGVEIENLLKPIYSQIKPQIDAFGLILNDEFKKTSFAVTYTANMCLDIGMEFCYATGFGFAFNFRNEIYYYQTGVQALTLQATDDHSLVPGSVSFDVAYDLLGDISYAPGNLYSLDASISAGITGKIAGGIVGKIKDDETFVKDAFVNGGYSLSYLVGVDSLALNKLVSGTAKCLGISFGHSLVEVSGGLIPGAAFGISRVATITSTQITKMQQDGVNADDNTCAAEQLWSITFGFPRPDIELS